MASSPVVSRSFQVTGFSLSTQLADDQGRVLMTTVAMPVFSKQNETVSTGAVLPAWCEEGCLLRPLSLKLW